MSTTWKIVAASAISPRGSCVLLGVGTYSGYLGDWWRRRVNSLRAAYRRDATPRLAVLDIVVRR